VSLARINDSALDILPLKWLTTGLLVFHKQPEGEQMGDAALAKKIKCKKVQVINGRSAARLLPTLVCQHCGHDNGPGFELGYRGYIRCSQCRFPVHYQRMAGKFKISQGGTDRSGGE
jgi:hypothetical protein